MKQEVITLNALRNVTLTCYLQAAGREYDHVTRRPAMVVLPGGGYQYCSEREADPIAFAYLEAGYQVFILRYSLKEQAVWPNPLEDFDQAMALIRENADRWDLYPDKIAVVGFSAGGHLAAAAATMAKNRPNAAILGYAVAGEEVQACVANAPDTTQYVDRNTCPCFLFATRDDPLVPIHNTIDFLAALDQANVSFESHIYAYGPHGISTAHPSILNPNKKACARAPRWVADSISWLEDVLGAYGPDGMEPPVCGPYFTGDNDPFLSISCTVGHLLRFPEAAALLEPYNARLGLRAARRVPLVTLLRDMMRLPEAELTALEEALKRIPNPQR